MPRDGRIIDIRYCHGAFEQLASSPLKSLANAQWVGDRLARKLREYGLQLGKRDHLYLHLEIGGPSSGVERCDPTSSFSRDVRCHVDPDELRGLSDVEREDRLADLTCTALRLECEDGLELIERAREELARHRRGLGVEYWTKETKRYRARVIHYLSPLVPGPLAPIRPKHSYFAVLEFDDLLAGTTGRARLLEFDGYDELHAAIGSLTVAEGELIIRPRRGHNHGVPISLSLAALAPPTS